ncbi:MAG: 50S ribosomal protein L7/L12 [Bdellovibrionales bacterium]|nr:50S ribosomal protein L7/L12 [Bdellovibrionales bacterium]
MSEAGNVTTDQVVDFIKNLKLIDAADLVKRLEDELGVTAAAPVAIAAAGVAGGAEAAEEKTDFTVTLDDAGAERVKVIKVVREITGLGLKEAKEAVDSAPKVLKEGASPEEADEIIKKLQEVGAKASKK